MTRRFVIGVSELTRAEGQALRAYLSENGTWWHWIPNFWLFVANDDSMTPDQIRDYIRDTNPRAKCVVVNADGGGGWAGRGSPNASGKPMFQWVRNFWSGQ